MTTRMLFCLLYLSQTVIISYCNYHNDHKYAILIIMPKIAPFLHSHQGSQHLDESMFHNQAMFDKNKTILCLLPPPNVTGSLHLGHALNIAIQSTKLRFSQQQGNAINWTPGTDHAGIATQLVSQRKLEQEGKNYKDLTTEKFIEYIWKVKTEHEKIVTNQMKVMKAPLNWDNYHFTLDKKVSDVVFNSFRKLYDKGLIYQDYRITNWDVKQQTALSDLEVDYRSATGTLYHVKYHTDSGFIIVATTRPETILGDTALCVNPDDERYKDLIGSHAYVPLIGRKIPIIADKACEKDFGTGVLKITPAHDTADFAIGQTHKLEMISVISDQGTMINVPSEYLDLTTDQAREIIIEHLKASGALIKEEKIKHQLPYGEKSNNRLECILTKQWFLNMQPLAEKSIKALKEDRIKFYPEYFKDICIQTLENLQPWCISRQLVWGHKIPIWYAKVQQNNLTDGINRIQTNITANPQSKNTLSTDTVMRTDSQNTDKNIIEKIFVCQTREDAMEMAVKTFGTTDVQLEQDTDVLDTWFSSALWPFSTQQYGIEPFIVNDFLVTGKDILFFWVARMIMMTLEMCDEVPFREVYLHGLVMDAQGKKMSKMVGNVLNPLDIIEEYNVDIMTLGLLSKLVKGRNVSIGKQNFELERNFITKIINAVKFCKLQGIHKINHELIICHPWCSWIVEQMNQTIDQVNLHMQEWDLSQALCAIKYLFKDQFCDWFLEVSKYDHDCKETLGYVMYNILQLLHPFIPHTTQEQLSILYGDRTIRHHDQLKYPLIACEYDSVILSQQIVTKCRSFIALGFDKTIELEVESEIDMKIIQGLSGANISALSDKSGFTYKTHNITFKLFLSNTDELSGIITKIKKELQEHEKVFQNAQKQLQNDQFLARADEDIIQQMQERVKQLPILITDLNTLLSSLI